MRDQDPQILEELASELAADVVRRYRIDIIRAIEIILNEWNHNPKLLDIVAAAGSAHDAKRTRVYKDAAMVIKRTIYNRLRSYRSDPAAFDKALQALIDLPPDASAEEVESAATAIASAHISTAERLGHRADFLDVLAAINPPGTQQVVDIGSGVLPTLLGGELLMRIGISQYWALDKDMKALAAVKAYAARQPERLIRSVQWNLADGWETLHRSGLPKRFDVAWMFKLVPVVLRQEPHLAPVLAAAPAPRLIISGSRIAMAKRQHIEARERRVVHRFCSDFGLSIVDEHVAEDEFFLLTERR